MTSLPSTARSRFNAWLAEGTSPPPSNPSNQCFCVGPQDGARPCAPVACARSAFSTAATSRLSTTARLPTPPTTTVLTERRAMTFHFRLPWSKPAEPLPHVVIRHVAATKEESRLARAKRVDRELELAVAVAQLTPEQKREALLLATRKRWEGV